MGRTIAAIQLLHLQIPSASAKSIPPILAAATALAAEAASAVAEAWALTMAVAQPTPMMAAPFHWIQWDQLAALLAEPLMSKEGLAPKRVVDAELKAASAAEPATPAADLPKQAKKVQADTTQKF